MREEINFDEVMTHAIIFAVSNFDGYQQIVSNNKASIAE